MTSVFCLFQTVNVNEESFDLLVHIYADEKEAHDVAAKLNAAKIAYYHVEIWNVQ